jgi:2-haloacid dehalogenase
VFDVGGVLVDWNPRHLYRSFFPGDEAGMEAFLAGVCTPEWNGRQDAGRRWKEAIAELSLQHPACTSLIAAYRERWAEMLGGPIAGVPEILGELRSAGVPRYGLSNWSGETFPLAVERYEFLRWLDGIVVSGDVGLVKPDPAIFQLLFERHAIEPSSAVLIDDSPVNVAAAESHGMVGVLFRDAAALRADLRALGLPVAPGTDRSAAW